MDTLQIPSGAVVVGIDGSEHSNCALTWAADQAGRDRRSLVIMHALGVIDPYWLVQPGVDAQALKESMIAGAQELLDQARDGVVKDHPGVDVSIGWKSGDARHLLIDASEHAGLIVVGSRGRGPVKRLLLGSVSLGVTRHAHCPVAVVRPDPEGLARGGVLVGIDGSAESLPTLDYAFRIAASRGATLAVVHCFWDYESAVLGAGLVDGDNERYADVRLLVAETLAGFRDKYPDVSVSVELARGLADDVLLELAHTSEVAVVGSRERSTLSDLILGSVAGALVERATCTVIVVPRS
jgi:nucleotide-binding universal stress UspA family protein